MTDGVSANEGLWGEEGRNKAIAFLRNYCAVSSDAGDRLRAVLVQLVWRSDAVCGILSHKGEYALAASNYTQDEVAALCESTLVAGMPLGTLLSQDSGGDCLCHPVRVSIDDRLDSLANKRKSLRQELAEIANVIPFSLFADGGNRCSVLLFFGSDTSADGLEATRTGLMKFRDRLCADLLPFRWHPDTSKVVNIENVYSGTELPGEVRLRTFGFPEEQVSQILADARCCLGKGDPAWGKPYSIYFLWPHQYISASPARFRHWPTVPPSVSWTLGRE